MILEHEISPRLPVAALCGDAVSAGADLNRFLASVEKKAFYIAKASVRNEDDALDLVQDAMFTLARKYADKPADELRPLFYRILKNRITDWHRKTSVRGRFFSFFQAGEDDPLDRVPGPQSSEPSERARLDGATDRLITLVSDLPRRQQQAFLLRSLEGLSVAETAKAMGCSAGSVKTHYSRAVHSLRPHLEEHVS
jgi:RNA polymerase sigma-70 factor (ECF subfamily)